MIYIIFRSPAKKNNTFDITMPRHAPSGESADGVLRRKKYTIADKAKFLDFYHEERRRNPYVTLAPIAKLYGMKLTTATAFIKDEETIRKNMRELAPQATKNVARMSKRSMKIVEDALLRWFNRERLAGEPSNLR
jgi:hypothetical protein